MKKNIIIIAAFFGMLLGATSCQDMLETESKRQIFDPQLNEKTDSMFYTLGILKGVQQAIDQYVLVNEMRGDLATVNNFTSADLRALANFSATAENKYDSAYVFYRIINNCNYFIAHRDTMLLTGSRNVTIPEYVQAKAIRAWAYIQLARFYGEVPFYTEPVTSISEANQVREKKDIKGICAALAPDLARYAGTALPTYGSEVSIGYTNMGSEKIINTVKTMFPVDIVLGDLYLEADEYENAAKSYFAYLKNNEVYAPYYVPQPTAFPMEKLRDIPANLTWGYTTRSYVQKTDWSDQFLTDRGSEIITYVPMAVNKLRGQVTDLPRIFGYDYYYVAGQSSAVDENGMYIPEREIDPSPAYLSLASSQDYYYVIENTSERLVNTLRFGDVRRYMTLNGITINDSTFAVNRKFQRANIPVYRIPTVYLRLAEAINRMGYPDAAFAILKDGLHREMADDYSYLSEESHQMLRTTIPFFSEENIAGNFVYNFGIHAYGSGHTMGAFSPYQLDTEVQKRVDALNKAFGLSITSRTEDVLDEEGNVVETKIIWNKEDLINAMEDILCDEYALEFALEGYRFGDLTRLARHKNNAGTYGSDFGSRWFAKKMEGNHPVVDLTNQQNWYLPLGK
jgi:hypothetical protein